jgi:hypothetical protein
VHFDVEDPEYGIIGWKGCACVVCDTGSGFASTGGAGGWEEAEHFLDDG